MVLKAYIFVFDGMADWEPALALCEINKSKRFGIVTVGFSADAVTTMGGYRISPDITLAGVKPEDAAVFIMSGGEMWEQGPHEDVIGLLRKLHAKGVVVAAICGASLEIVRAGLTHGLRHTSNTKGYLKAMLPAYADDDFYVDRLAVADGNLITASGLGSVEFACEILRLLAIYTDEEIRELYEMFKHGIIPARYAL